MARVANVVPQDLTTNQMPTLFIQVEGINVTTAKNDLVLVVDRLVAGDVAADTGVVHRVVEIVNDVTGDVRGGFGACLRGIGTALHGPQHHKR